MMYVNPNIYAKDTGDTHRGKGVFASTKIAKGEIITHITEGRILTKDEYVKVPGEYSDYCCSISDDSVFCTSDFEKPTIDWLINHSCDPNTGSGGDIYTFVAMRDIEPGEEITIDYAMVDADPASNMSCACGAPNCRKIIRGNDWQLPELQEKYKGYFQKNIQEKIDVLKRER